MRNKDTKSYSLCTYYIIMQAFRAVRLTKYSCIQACSGLSVGKTIPMRPSWNDSSNNRALNPSKPSWSSLSSARC